ncbi:hypothetical protein D0469_06585 [Peribacillus saganii]|uniref:EamA domain-containing protein n=1 Tax=Peribacillus saganii TaxID=2303992 RepID=A0A372LRP4_9BACI|nr:EamA family transporter [Peribacillus saganii]RFU70587.1 hypothetical protein D0469_06585 [Peribacillus saganii]
MKNGILLAVLSSLVFSIMNALVKAVSLNIPSAEVMFFRSIIGTAMIYFLMVKSQVAFSKKGIPMLLVRGLLGALYLFAFHMKIVKYQITLGIKS